MRVQRSPSVPAPSIPREKGNNMQPFLMPMEQRFRKMALPPGLWGDERGDYPDEEALQCWMDLKQSGADMIDRSLIKQELIKNFCTVDRATLICRMATNKWNGDYSIYTANFGRIVAHGAQLSAEDLVGYFLTNIPAELRWDRTQRERRTAAQAPSGNREVVRNIDNSRDANDGVSIEERQSVTNVESPPRWREFVANEGSKMEGMLCSVGTMVVLPVEVVGRSYEALLDTGASRSFINPRLAEALQLKMRKLLESVHTWTNELKTVTKSGLKGLHLDNLSRHDNPQAEEVLPTPSAGIKHAMDDEYSPWHTDKLAFTLFDQWMQSPESQDLPQEIREGLQAHRHVFPGNMPPGVPPKPRPDDHNILLALGKLPAKSAIYRMTPDQLRFHKQEIAKLSADD
ncbi:hypothetical protein, conserved [Eimeria brunetti]|uniref:Uncharacterized protein n=1 Tax=Eimeria brunetti TaxID=51314 RepID=U6LR18_9EIME|nr:hypothetical protein, conserved [Eimeria brunetti]